MKIENHTFGAITFEEDVRHDVVRSPLREVVKRKKNYQKALWYPAMFLKDEASCSSRTGVDPGHHWFGSDVQRSPIHRKLKPISKERLRRPVEADTRGDRIFTDRAPMGSGSLRDLWKEEPW